MKEEVQRIAEAAVTAGVITDNADNALFHVAETVLPSVSILGTTIGLAPTSLCYMNGYQDSRREKYFTMGKGNGKTDGTAGSKEGYYGIRIGTLPTGVTDDQLKSVYSNRLMTATDPYTWMTAAEVAFLRAEGALRGWAMGGKAKDLYEQGIALSFAQHGASGLKLMLPTTAWCPQPMPTHWANTTPVPRPTSKSRGTQTPKQIISKRISNVSSRRSGLPSTRWASKHGANAAARVIPKCCPSSTIRAHIPNLPTSVYVACNTLAVNTASTGDT